MGDSVRQLARRSASAVDALEDLELVREGRLADPTQ
jgi:hypothetical protein